MLVSLANNIGTILAAAGLVAIVTAAAVKLVKDRKQGKSSCGCNCAHCAMAGQCHPAAPAEPKGHRPNGTIQN